MINYYELLDVDPKATEDQVRTKLKEKRRLWTQRQNAPKLEQQQEASNNLRLVPEIEDTLFDPQKRSNYDIKLKEYSNKNKEVNTDTDNIGIDTLIIQIRDLLCSGNIGEACMLATKATEIQGNHPDAWALLGEARAKLGDFEDAIFAYKRAIRLKPNDGSLNYFLGRIFEELERFEDAMQQYQRATKIHPECIDYHAAIGNLLIQCNQFNAGIEILDSCLREEPSNIKYKHMLARAYANSYMQNWTYVREGSTVAPGYYATTDEQIRQAEELLKKAIELSEEDPNLGQYLQENYSIVLNSRKRRFDGNKFAAGSAIALGSYSISLGDFGTLELGILLLVFGILYIVSCLTPQYKLISRIISGNNDTLYNYLSEMYYGQRGIVLLIISNFIYLGLLPLITVINFTKNYALK